MRGRLNGLRKLLVDKRAARKTSMDCSFIARERGMFSFLGITKEQLIGASAHRRRSFANPLAHPPEATLLYPIPSRGMPAWAE